MTTPMAVDPLELVLGSFPSTRLDPETIARIGEGMPGVTLFRNDNVGTLDDLLSTTAAAHDARADGLPAVVAIDQEAGQLQALAGIATDFPGNMAMGAADDPELARRVGHAIGRELRALGVTVNYAPVCDLLTNPTNHALSIRSFGDDPERVAALGAAVVDGLQAGGVAATAKHFPGKGAAPVDTHHALAIIDMTAAEFRSTHLRPFVDALGADARLVMTSHAAVPALTGGEARPMTVSHEVLTSMLRDELGFDGVTITDALDMGAITAGPDAAAAPAIAAIGAGTDLLLTTPRQDLGDFVDRLRRAATDGLLDPVRLTEAVGRTLALRRWLAARPTPAVDVVRCAEHAALARELAEAALTRVGPPRAALGAGVAVVQPTSVDLTPADTSGVASSRLAPALAALGADVNDIEVPHSPSGADLDVVSAAVAGRTAVVVVTAAATEPAQAELVVRVAERASDVVLVAARNPLDLKVLGWNDTAYCTYGLSEPMVVALASTLVGAREARGRLPITG